ncbi:MAG: CbtB-domain containing protein [Acidobacteria bacterium]|nr:CbtB-domain containing protein [Acidobacteriota bacterium]
MQATAALEQAQSRTAQATAWLPGLAVMIFGFLMVIGVGFSQISAAHNATHDSRHAAGFPCH